MSSPIADPVLLANQMAEMADKRIDILRRINDVGSISKAARMAGVSYKAAWQAIETLSNLAGGPLVEKEVGGAHGGGTRLTEKGVEVLNLANDLTRARLEVLARYRLKEQPALTNLGLSTLSTSMRNMIPALIRKVKIGSALVRLTLRLGDGQELRSSITMESAQLLGIREGASVLALCKATAIEILRPELVSDALENCIRGVVIRSVRERRGGECSIQLENGQTIIGFVPPEHGLHIGSIAVACIPAESIVIAING